jgi:GNAT superfamily N-acetyltransferase
MREVLTDRSPAALAAAVRRNLHEFDRYSACSANAEWFEAGGFFRWRTPVPHAWCNGVICTGAPGPDAATLARGAIEYFRPTGTPAFTWWLASGARPEDWSPILRACGYGYDEQTPGMAVDLDEVPEPRPAGVEIRPVTDGEELKVWARTFATGFEVPDSFAGPLHELYDSLRGAGSPLRHYVAFLGGEPVATSSLFLGAGVAGIYDVATLRASRGKGLGSAVTATPLLEARAEGYRVGILQSSAMGLPVYERLGFRTVCAMEHFFWKEEPAGPTSLTSPSRG